MQNKKKVLFVLPTLGAGGAERVMSFVCKNLDNNLFDAKLIVLGFQKDNVFDVENVSVTYLNKSRLLLAIPALFKVIIQEKPSFVIGSIIHVNVMMGFFSVFLRKIKFIGREASVVSKMNEFSTFNSKFKTLLIKVFYPRLTFLVCQSEDMRKDFISTFNLKSSSLVLIHNPITFKLKEELEQRNSYNLDNVNFVTVGRLSGEKGYFRIIEGLSKIQGYSFSYCIIGCGPLEKQIKQLVEKYGLSDKVSFIPFTSNVLGELINKDYFIQGSYVEGFPNALLESCTVGTPVIAFNALGGTKDIVMNGENGFLVENENDFSSLLNNLDRLKSIERSKVKLSVINKFNSEKILSQYEELLNS
ncbi:glycosyltransferase [Flavobacterium collinsii]|uniref:N-acetylgalactosamine-N, N'-diacetylbacillosaminyl-diphospho-undecaprenol 4-alpha-N-acetylgalactosaminyltransferase n=1 Tax=Flavobacterium collinsii TaxID=1114861 RepID=A0ABN7ESC2_9FLAO|nr:glycosyltransferase [Flavobacterium collinsii]CAA9203394.1 N-acetylgalactosamine-N, N'-diacetylbacillosaminyl-diphospho-undecaprenol 4-alpha-N-acetylgalactosaminyltransferase [Flavobacterium collinsii]